MIYLDPKGLRLPSYPLWPGETREIWGGGMGKGVLAKWREKIKGQEEEFEERRRKGGMW